MFLGSLLVVGDYKVHLDVPYRMMHLYNLICEEVAMSNVTLK